MCAVCMQEPEKRSEDGIRHPGTGVKSGVSHHVGVGNKSWGFRKSSNHSDEKSFQPHTYC